MNTALLSARDSEAKAKFEYALNALQGDVSGDMVRSRSTPLGKAMAERMKTSGVTLNELIAKKTTSMFGLKANFNSLSETQKNQVYTSINM